MGRNGRTWAVAGLLTLAMALVACRGEATPTAAPSGPTASAPVVGAYLVQQDLDGALWRVGEGGRRQLSPSTERWGRVAWSAAPDARRLALLRGSGFQAGGQPALALWLVDADGSNGRQLQELLPSRPLDPTPDGDDWLSLLWPLYEQAPAWGPDGQQVAFLSAHQDQVDLYLAGADGRVTRLTETPELELRPRWSPDGRLLAAITSPGFDRQIGWTPELGLVVVPAAGGAPLQLRAGAELAGDGAAWRLADLSWVDDDHLAVSLVGAPAGSRVLLLNVKTGAVSTLLRAAGQGPLTLSWSPTARTLAISSSALIGPGSPAGLYLWRAGQATAHAVERDAVEWVEWSPVGGDLAYGVGQAGGRPGLRLGSSAEGDGWRQATDRPAIAGRWSPDGRRLALTTAVAQAEGQPLRLAGAIYRADGTLEAPLPTDGSLWLIGWDETGLYYATGVPLAGGVADAEGQAWQLWRWSDGQARPIGERLEGMGLELVRPSGATPAGRR